MADLDHADLPEELLHEPKGASTASFNTWCRANGDGTTTFTALPEETLLANDSLTSTSTVNQLLTSAGDSATVAFGSAATSSGGSISISSAGVITFNETGVYAINVRGFFGRTSSTGVSTVLVSGFTNGVQSGATVPVNLDDDEIGFDVDIADSSIISVSAGTTLDYRMYLKVDDGGESGLVTTTHAGTGFNTTPSARVTIRKLEV